MHPLLKPSLLFVGAIIVVLALLVWGIGLETIRARQPTCHARASAAEKRTRAARRSASLRTDRGKRSNRPAQRTKTAARAKGAQSGSSHPKRVQASWVASQANPDSASGRFTQS